MWTLSWGEVHALDLPNRVFAPDAARQLAEAGPPEPAPESAPRVKALAKRWHSLVFWHTTMPKEVSNERYANLCFMWWSDPS